MLLDALRVGACLCALLVCRDGGGEGRSVFEAFFSDGSLMLSSDPGCLACLDFDAERVVPLYDETSTESDLAGMFFGSLGVLRPLPNGLSRATDVEGLPRGCGDVVRLGDIDSATLSSATFRTLVSTAGP